MRTEHNSRTSPQPPFPFDNTFILNDDFPKSSYRREKAFFFFTAHAVFIERDDITRVTYDVVRLRQFRPFDKWIKYRKRIRSEHAEAIRKKSITWEIARNKVILFFYFFFFRYCLNVHVIVSNFSFFVFFFLEVFITWKHCDVRIVKNVFRTLVWSPELIEACVCPVVAPRSA